MALTPAEQKKMLRIEREISEKEKELEAIKTKGAEDFAKQAMKLNLWRLDKKTATEELKKIADKHKTL